MKQAPTELENWERAAAQWSQQADRIAAATAAMTEGLLARLAPAPGQRLLDVAAGPGDPSLRLAELVGPTGHVVATDGVAGMLETLARRAHERGLSNITTRLTPAESLDLPAHSFDGACSRFGVMFFAEPARALLNVRRAVRPGGRLVLAAWGAREANPYFTLPTQVLEDAGLPDDTPPGARTVFEYAAPGQLASLVRDAGWKDVREECVALPMPLHGVTPEGVLDYMMEVSRRLADRVEPLDAARRAAVRAGLAQRTARFATPAGIVLPAEVLYVSGTA
jgi:ubiquinone/menaquinone biosynthesis C-methylase UbiE